jgi:hypothetical protein
MRLYPPDLNNLAGTDTELGREHVSHTAIGAWNACREKYRWSRVENLVPAITRSSLSTGRAFAHALEHNSPSAGDVFLREQAYAESRGRPREPVGAPPATGDVDIQATIAREAARAYLAAYGAHQETREYEARVRIRNPRSGYPCLTHDLVGRIDAVSRQLLAADRGQARREGRPRHRAVPAVAGPAGHDRVLPDLADHGRAGRRGQVPAHAEAVDPAPAERVARGVPRADRRGLRDAPGVLPAEETLTRTPRGLPAARGGAVGLGRADPRGEARGRVHAQHGRIAATSAGASSCRCARASRAPLTSLLREKKEMGHVHGGCRMTALALPTVPADAGDVADHAAAARVFVAGFPKVGKSTLLGQWAPETTLIVDTHHGTDLLDGEHFVQHVSDWTSFERASSI